MFNRSHRLLPRLRFLFKKQGNFRPPPPPPPPTYECQKSFYNRRDPFSQMEKFMKDIEKKFWREFDNSILPTPSRAASGSRRSFKFSDSPGVMNLSSGEKYKMEFNFLRANPEDIKVTLKDRNLTVEAKIQESNENSEMQQSYFYEYTIPEGVDTDALQSLLSEEGILTIEAPRSSGTPRPIYIKKE